MSSVIPQPWAIKHCPHLNQILEHTPGFSGMKKSTSYFRYAILAYGSQQSHRPASESIKSAGIDFG